VRQAVERLRRAGYAQSDRLVLDPAMEQNRSVRVFQRVWKGVTWVVLASWDGSLAYRIPVDRFHNEWPREHPKTTKADVAKEATQADMRARRRRLPVTR
jgi:hypothetical protein